MGIVFLSSQVPDPRLNRRIKSLSSLGKQLTVLYWERTYGFGFKLEPRDNVKYIALKSNDYKSLIKRLKETISLQKTTFSILKDIDPEIIYISGIECVRAAEKVRQIKSVLLVLEIADLIAIRYIERSKVFKNQIESWVNRLISKADALVITSPFYYSEYYRDRVDILEERIFLFENVPERRLFGNFRKRKFQNTFNVGFVGGVRYYESIKTLFEAARELNNVEVIVSGLGPDFDRVMELSKSYKNTKITGKYDYEKDILEVYSKLDLIYSVYESDSEGVRLALPNKLYEAIVCEIPIVVSKGTCLEKYVKGLGVGYSVEYGNVEELRSLLVHLATFPKDSQEISNRESIIAERFFYENREKEFLRWLSTLI